MKRMVFLFGFLFLLISTYAYGQEAVLATKLWEEFRTNEFAFENRYVGKKIIIRGEAFSISRNTSGKPTLVFKCGGLSFVQCEFPEQYAASLAKINPGDTVRVSGYYQHKMLTSLFFKNCGSAD
jgi:hypothetical protein